VWFDGACAEFGIGILLKDIIERVGFNYIAEV